MLGKYYEKTDSADPKSCLNCYYQAFETLRTQNGALYPLKVNYSEPQTGAVESLELFYRIHATILKFIDRSGDHVLDPEIAAFYLEMVRKLSVSRFIFSENDPLDASGAAGNVTTVEEENEQDVEIICTVQEVMNKILMMTQMASEQDLDEEDTSSESEVSSSEESESESDSTSESESEESSDETSSSEEEKEEKNGKTQRNEKESGNNKDKMKVGNIGKKIGKDVNEKIRIGEDHKTEAQGTNDETKVERAEENDKTQNKTSIDTPEDCDNTKAENGKKRKQASSSGEEDNNGEKKMKTEDKNETESRKRKNESVEKEEHDSKRVKAEDQEQKWDVKLEQGEEGIADNRNEDTVRQNTEKSNEKVNSESHLKKIEARYINQVILNDGSHLNTSVQEDIQKNSEAVKCETVEVKLEENKNNQGIVEDNDKLSKGNIADTCTKSNELSEKSSTNDIRQQSTTRIEIVDENASQSNKTKNVTKENENVMTPKEIENPTKVEPNTQESKRPLSLPSKKMKILDSINLLDSINSSCDNIFENLNKIVSTCDSAVQESESRMDDANSEGYNETNAVESDNASVNTRIESTRTESKLGEVDSKDLKIKGIGPELNKLDNVSKVGNIKTDVISSETPVRSDECHKNSIDMDVEIIEDASPTAESVENEVIAKPDDKVTEIVIEDSMEDIEILDPESGMFITTKQRKPKENEEGVGDSEKKNDGDSQNSGELKRNDKSSVDTQSNPSIGGVEGQENTARVQDDTKMDMDQNKTYPGIESEKAATEMKELNPTKPVQDSSKSIQSSKVGADKSRAKNKKIEMEESSSEEEDSESSESESSGSSEEEKIQSSKKKIPPKRKPATKHTKKQVPRNEQTTKKKRELRKWKRNKKEIVSYCASALEECHRRFPEHFKSLYRLAYHYYHSTSDRDVDKARSILLDGLFRQRKQKNFFNGLWRPPILDLDRPGSFAYHMSRSIHLVIDLLSETKDGRTLMDIAVALKDEPEAEKKYLRDNEREQFCQDALTVCEKLLKDNLEDIRRNAIHTKSGMKKIFFDAKYIHSTYSHSKAWGSKDSVFSKLYGEIRMLLQKTMAGLNESSLVEESQPKKSKVSGSSGDKGVATEKTFERTEKEMPTKKETSAYSVSPLPQISNPVPQPVPLPRVQPPVSLAGDMFGSHFLASSFPRPSVPQPRILHPRLPLRSSTPPQEMSLQQKLAAKQNPTGKLKNIGPTQTQPLKNIGPTQIQPLPGKNTGLAQAQHSQQSGYASTAATSSDSMSGKVYKPGKLTSEPGIIQSSQLQKPTNSSSVPPPKIVTINPTKYLNKTKQKLQQEGAKSLAKPDGGKLASIPNVIIKPLQKPAHLIEHNKVPSQSDLPTAFKLPKSVSLTKVNANPPPARPESSKAKPASITKVMEPKRSESPKLKNTPVTKVVTESKTSASPQIIDLTTTNLPKAISISKVQAEGSKPSAQGQADKRKKSITLTEPGKIQPKSVKIKKLQKDGANSLPRKSGNGAALKSNHENSAPKLSAPGTSNTSPAGGLQNKLKTSLGTKSKTKEMPSGTSTTALKNFRKPNTKESKDKEDIIMIELD
ncbi:hypothetical protein WDU94_001451 [Cyamophila willieti]